MATATAAKPKTKSAAFKKICKSFDVDHKRYLKSHPLKMHAKHSN
jgi:hypothetical protein